MASGASNRRSRSSAKRSGHEHRHGVSVRPDACTDPLPGWSHDESVELTDAIVGLIIQVTHLSESDPSGVWRRRDRAVSSASR
jgi:hypothetical protein